MSALLRRAIFPITAISLVGVGAAFTWGWPEAAVLVGLMVWIDLTIASVKK